MKAPSILTIWWIFSIMSSIIGFRSFLQSFGANTISEMAGSKTKKKFLSDILNQTWGASHKSCKGYVIAKNKDEYHRIKYYDIVIQKLERELVTA
jgi:hypothetical protein